MPEVGWSLGVAVGGAHWATGRPSILVADGLDDWAARQIRPSFVGEEWESLTFMASINESTGSTGP